MPATNQHPSHSPARSTGAAANSPAQTPISLPAPYFCQRGSATAEGLRMCFSSTCAMAAEYLRLVRQFGDTTEAHAQIEALRLLGIPIQVGWLHQGPVIEPRGGCHWSLEPEEHRNAMDPSVFHGLKATASRSEDGELGKWSPDRLPRKPSRGLRSPLVGDT